MSVKFRGVHLLVVIASACWALGAMAKVSPAAGAANSPSDPRDISPLLTPLVTKHHIVGLAAVLVKEDAVIAIGAAGLRRGGQPGALAPTDTFHLGSCSKAMTATVIAMLVDEGKLSWESTIESVFPQDKGRMSKEFAGITLAQLLHHRAGLANDGRPDGAWRRMRSFAGTPFEARHELFRLLSAKPPTTPPGKQYEYSNAGYAIAAHMAERVSRKSFEDLLRERLFAPLKMSSAGFGEPTGNDAPWGSNADGAPVRPGPASDNPPAYTPSGRIHASLVDWAKFISLHLQGQAEGVKLSADSLKMLHEPVADAATPYAMGWIAVPRDWAGGTALTHSGTNTHWYATAWLAPERRFAVLIACNQGGDAAQAACDDAATALILEFLRRP